MDFKLHSQYEPTGDQPQAIKELVDGVNSGLPCQTLLGVTGSGKTFTMANVIAQTNRPTLVLSHNKTLAAQLYAEFKSFFPENSVQYFVSYYDYYQPEAYLPSSDKYIEKDLAINKEIDRLRLATVTALLSGRRDVIVVSSVSCLYGMGNPENIEANIVRLKVGDSIGRDEFLRRLVDALYSRNEYELSMGTFRVKGDTVDVMIADTDAVLRVIFWGDEIESMELLDPLTMLPRESVEGFNIYPANIFVTSKESIASALGKIDVDLGTQVDMFYREDRPVEAKRLYERVTYDLEMIREVGYCSGIENYSRYFDGREPGARPYCLLDYLPKDFLTIIDESHATVPQVRAMYGGDRSRKDTLVNYGFRLDAARDNRPLTFTEFEALTNQTIYVSATPADYELERCEGVVTEQIIRPTGLLDPKITVRPSLGQIDDLIHEIELRVENRERVLVTTLTKRSAEDLTAYLHETGIRVEYLHSGIDALERVAILGRLRKGEFDCLIGINLLREGLDFPEVALVAILDADKEGFLRSTTSLVQTAGRCARHVNGRVILYADHQTDAIRDLLRITKRHRDKQMAYNKAHHITPKSVKRAINEAVYVYSEAKKTERAAVNATPEKFDVAEAIASLQEEMLQAADALEFERAAYLRDQIKALQTLSKER